MYEEKINYFGKMKAFTKSSLNFLLDIHDIKYFLPFFKMWAPPLVILLLLLTPLPSRSSLCSLSVAGFYVSWRVSSSVAIRLHDSQAHLHSQAAKPFFFPK